MIFPDGTKKIGYYNKNVFAGNLEEIAELDIEHTEGDSRKNSAAMNGHKIPIEVFDGFPSEFKQEVREFLGIYGPDPDIDEEGV